MVRLTNAAGAMCASVDRVFTGFAFQVACCLYGCEVGSGGGLRYTVLRSVRSHDRTRVRRPRRRENDLRTAQSETDPHRQDQYARSAPDSAAEVAVNGDTSDADRARAVEAMDAALALARRSLLREAQSTLARAAA